MSQAVTEKYQALCDWSKQELAARHKGETIRIQVGSATCEHAAGSLEVLSEFKKHVASSGREDIELHLTGCTGRCSREPLVGVFMPGQMPVKYERVDRDLVHKIFVSHIQGGVPLMDHVLDSSLEKLHRYEFLVCSGSNCGKCASEPVHEIFEKKLRLAELGVDDVQITKAGCFGACNSSGDVPCTHILVRPDKVLYRICGEKDLDEIINSHIMKGEVVERLVVKERTISQEFLSLYGDVSFFNCQSRIALKNNGLVDPESLEEYIKYNGFRALATVLEQNAPEAVIDQIDVAKLRGRGGGGFPTAIKWRMMRKQEEQMRYIICNGDEGDPGAFMDRSMLESDPYNIIEGMIIGGFATGASQGYFYIRAEYPLAIKRIEHAIEQCRANGILGENVLGSGFSFDLEIQLGAGAFVCGEETALIRSIEGERGQPRIRPPYPTDRGLWGKPTSINNVETFANISAIINYGGEWFHRTGTEKSGGTKVFALAGQVVHTGLVEVPLGTPLRKVVEEIGGGVPDGKALKAIQTGGPAGGFIPASEADIPVDFDTLGQMGSIMGSGGMIVLSEDDCMVDVAKFYLAFSCDESCGKCTPCREGTTRMLEILDRITSGKAVLEDLDKLERLAKLMKRTALCGLGRAAPNPVLSGLKYFREEYERHVIEKRCPAKKCTALVQYEIIPENCIGCTVCARKCPAQCISGARKEVHVIHQEDCIKCGHCYEHCRFNAIARI